MQKRFVIVEHAGMIRECDITHFPTRREAASYIRGHYEPDELDSMGEDYMGVHVRLDELDESGELVSSEFID